MSKTDHQINGYRVLFSENENTDFKGRQMNTESSNLDISLQCKIRKIKSK